MKREVDEATMRTPQRASVVFDAPHGPEAIQIADGEAAPFGRAMACKVRFAYAPEPDLHVHGIAGRFLVFGDRVTVETAPNAKPLTLVPSEGSRAIVGVDEAHSPRCRTFEVLVPGADLGTWRLRVAVRSNEVVERLTGPDPKTHTPTLDFGEADWKILRAYAKPILEGGSSVETHQEVAQKLHYSKSWVRRRVYELWSDMFEAGVVMPDVKDKVQAAVHGVLLNGLLERT